MELSPSLQVASCAASLEFPNILWNPKDHYRIHKSPPARSIQSIPSHLNSLISVLILSSQLRLGFIRASFLLAFLPKSYMHSSSLSFVLYVLPIASSLPWSFWLYLAKSTSYEAPHYAVLSKLLSLHLSSVLIFSSAPSSQTRSVHITLLMSQTKFHINIKLQAKLWFSIL
jgi:hypothetical protein